MKIEKTLDRIREDLVGALLTLGPNSLTKKEKIEEFGGLKKDEKELISNYIQVGLITETDTSWVLSLKGKMQADGIASSLFRLNKKN